MKQIIPRHEERTLNMVIDLGELLKKFGIGFSIPIIKKMVAGTLMVSIAGSLNFKITRKVKKNKERFFTRVEYDSKPVTVEIPSETALFILRVQQYAKEMISLSNILEVLKPLHMEMLILHPKHGQPKQVDKKFVALLDSWREIIRNKNEAVKTQKYEQAAKYKDEENKIFPEMLKHLRSTYPSVRAFKSELLIDALRTLYVT